MNLNFVIAFLGTSIIMLAAIILVELADLKFGGPGI